MTHEQKQLLRAVPCAALLVAGLFAYQYRMRDAVDRAQEELAVPPAAGPGPQEIERATGQLRAAADLRVLAAVERQLEKDEEFVRAVEAAYPATRGDGQVEARQKLDEQIDKAVAAINGRQSALQGVRGDGLSDRARAAVAAARCAALVERLAGCRRPVVPGGAGDR